MKNNIFIKIASFFWPITTKITSDVNGDLELTWYQGKKVLDTKNANFSYGSLDNILEEAFKYTHVNPNDKILILGLGAGNFIKKIRRKFHHKGQITAIELDKQIIKIAATEFDIKNSPNLTIINENAIDYVLKSNEKFDFILIDIFVDNIVPQEFYSFQFWNAISNLLEPNARLLFNAGILLKDSKVFNLIINKYKGKIRFIKKENVNKTNTLLLGFFMG